MVQQGSNFQTRPTWSIWHETFVHSANTGGVLTIGSEYQSYLLCFNDYSMHVLTLAPSFQMDP